MFWIEGAANPADKLGKFNIDNDSVDKWINLAKNVLQPKWLQQHPSTYLNKLLSKSQEKIKSLLQGGVSEMEPNHLTQSDEDLPDQVEVRHVNCYEGYIPRHSIQGGTYDTSLLQGLIDRNKHKGSAYCMKIMGLVTYITHKWRDKTFLKKKRECKHPHECPYDIKLLQERKLDRPFLGNPIRRPMIIDNKI